MSERSDHDVLICLEVKIKELQKGFDNHLNHHFRYNILAWTVTLGALVTTAIALIKVM